MNTRSVVLFCLAFVGVLLAASGYYLAGPGETCWWTQREDTPIRIEVVDSSDAHPAWLGKFGIGGNPAAFPRLTHNFHWPLDRGEQHFVLNLDGTFFSNYPYVSGYCGIPLSSLGFYYLVDSFFVANDTFSFPDSFGTWVGVTSHWRIRGSVGYIDIYQELKPVRRTFGPDSVGMCRIKYRVVNNDIVAHTVGLKLVVDVDINGNDRPDVAIAGTFSPTNGFFQAPVPAYWQAYDNISDPSAVVARGILRGGDCTPPDIFAVGNRYPFYNYIWIEPSCTTTGDSLWTTYWPGSPTFDVGFAIQWNPITVDAGSYRDFVTYYGFGSNYNPPHAINVSPIPFDVTPYNCTIDTVYELCAVVWQEDELGATYNNVVVCVDPPDPMAVLDTTTGTLLDSSCITLDSLPVSDPHNLCWLVYVPLSLISTGFSGYIHYYANSPDADSATYDSTAITVPHFSQIPPDMWFLGASDLVFVNCTTYVAEFAYSDDEGVQLPLASEIPPIVNGVSDPAYIVSPLPDNPTADTFYVHPPGTLFYSAGACTISVPYPPDIYGCQQAETLTVVAVWDSTPPVVYDLFPSPDSVVTTPTPTISFRVADSLAGVALDSIEFTVAVGGLPPTSFYPTSPGVSHYGDSSEYLIMYTLTDVPCETTVTVCVTKAADLVSVCHANMLPDTVCWSFTVDYCAPRVEFITPPESVYISCDTPLVCFTVEDLNGFTTDPPESFEVWIDDVMYTPSMSQVNISGDTVCITDELNYPYASGSEVSVEIRALSDTVGNSLDSVVSLVFYIDNQGPLVTVVDPPDSSIIGDVAGFPICSLYVLDTDCGVVMEGMFIRAWTSGGDTSVLSVPTEAYISLSGYLVIQPAWTGLSYLDTVHICLDSLFDCAQLCGPNNIDSSVCLTYIVDNEGPSAELVHPEEGAHTSCMPGADMLVCVSLEDISGIDPSSICLSVGGSAPVCYPGVSWDPVSGQACMTVPFDASIDGECDSVAVIVVAATDSVGNTSAYEDTFYYIVDTVGPYISAVSPSHGALVISDDFYVVFHDDCAGIMRSSAAFHIWYPLHTPIIDTIIYGSDGVVSWSGDTAFVSPGIGVNGDSVCVHVQYASDSLDVADCPPNDLQNDTLWCFKISFGGPSISLVSPPTGSYLSCDSVWAVFTCQDSQGVDSTTIHFIYQINSGPEVDVYYPDPSITFVGGVEVHDPDTVYFALPVGVSDGDTVRIRFDYVADMLGVGSALGREGVFYVDFGSPQVVDYGPSDAPSSAPLVWAVLSDTIAGLEYDSLCFSITGGPRYCFGDSAGGSPIVFWSFGDTLGDTAFFDIAAAGTSFAGGDTVEVCVHVVDATVLCPPNPTDFCWDVVFELSPPTLVPIEPDSGWFVTCPTVDSIVLAVLDSNGVDWSTFHIHVDGPAGESYDLSYPSGMSLSGDTITVFLSPPIASEGTVWVSVDVQDVLANVSVLDFFFVIDHTAPVVVEYFPVCDTISDIIPGTLWVVVEDPYGLPDPEQLCVSILDTAGDTVSLCGDTSTAISASWDTLFVDLVALGIRFTGGDTVFWWITQIGDRSDLCEPNYGEPESCVFSISSQGPFVQLVSPDPGADGILFLGCAFPFTFTFSIYDADGFDPATLRLVYTCTATGFSDTIEYPSAELSLTTSGDTLGFLDWTPSAAPCGECDTFVVTISVLDNLSNAERPNEFRIAVDLTPPGFEVVSPPAYGDAYSLRPVIKIRFPDACAGPDTNSVCDSICWRWGASCTTVCNTGEQIQWSGDTMFFYTDSFDIQAQDTVWICVDSVADAADTCPNWAYLDTCFWVYIAQFGPIPTLINPVPDSVTGLVCANDSVVVAFYDPDGLVADSVRFAVNGVEVPLGADLYWAPDGTTLVYTATFDTTPVVVCVWHQTDLLGYVGDSTCFVLNIDLSPPVAFWVSPGTPAETISVMPGVPPVQIRIVDSLNCVDSTTIMLVVGSDTFRVEEGVLEWSRLDSLLTFHPVDTFFAGDTFDLCLSVGDSTGCGYSNVLDTCWVVVVISSEGPLPHLVAPSENWATIACAPYTSDFFTFAWWCEDPDGLRHGGAQISMRVNSGPTYTYGDASGHVTYSGDTLFFVPPETLYFAPPEGFEDGDTLFLQIVHVEDALGNPTSDMTEYAFIIDWSGPQVLGFGPTGGVTAGHPLMWWALSDVSPIDTTSPVVSVYVDGALLETVRWDAFLPDSIDWVCAGDICTLFVSGFAFSGGDTVRVCLDSIADLPDTCGPNWTTDTCFWFWLPQGGPVAELVVPHDSAVVYCGAESEDWDIVIALCDSQGVLFDSVSVVVTYAAHVDSFDADHPFAFALLEHIVDSVTHCDTIIIPSPLAPYTYSDGETVSVTLRAMDTLYNPSLVYTWVFFVDHSPPKVEDFVPDSGETIYDWHQEVSARVWDEISDVNVGAMRVLITDNGSPWLEFTVDSSAMWYDPSDSTLHVSIDSAGTLWAEFHEYCVYVYVSDTVDGDAYCEANFDSAWWCFTVGDDDTTGPQIFLSDSCLWPGFSPDFAISCSLWDESGIYDDMTDTAGQGIFVVVDTAGCPDLGAGRFIAVGQMDYDSAAGIAQTLPGAVGTYPPGTWLYYLVYVHDNDFDFGNPDDRALAISECGSCYFHDIEAPEPVALNPQDGWFYSCRCDSQDIVIALVDNDGVDLTTGTIRVNGVEYPFSSPYVSFSGAGGEAGTTLVIFSNPPESCWQSGDTVVVELYGFADVYLNVYPDTFRYSFVVDWEPPVVEYAECHDTTLYIEELDTVLITVFDSISGTDPDGIEIHILGKRLGGETYSHTYFVGDNGVEFDTTTQELVLVVPLLPGLRITNEDSVWIVVYDAYDRARSCGPNHIVDSLSCVKFIAAELECRAHPNPFTPNGDGANDVAFFDYPKRFFRDATIYIYDMQGVELRRIGVGPEHSYTWDGTDSQGNKCRPGVYLYVVEVDGEVICTGTVVLAR